MRKSLGAAALLALLVLPLVGSAGATTKDPTKVCALVKVAADVQAGANIGLYGKVLGKQVLNGGPAAAADVDGDVFAYICVKVDPHVALRVDKAPMVTPDSDCAEGKTGVGVQAFADLATTLQAGSVKVFVKVFADADGTVNPLTVDEEAEAKALINIDEELKLAAHTTKKGEPIVDLCVDIDAMVKAVADAGGEVDVDVGDDGGDKS